MGIGYPKGIQVNIFFNDDIYCTRPRLRTQLHIQARIPGALEKKYCFMSPEGLAY